jgi:hypothetical protein
LTFQLGLPDQKAPKITKQIQISSKLKDLTSAPTILLGEQDDAETHPRIMQKANL